jgi:hypothetical protein
LRNVAVGFAFLWILLSFTTFQEQKLWIVRMQTASRSEAFFRLKKHLTIWHCSCDIRTHAVMHTNKQAHTGTVTCKTVKGNVIHERHYASIVLQSLLSARGLRTWASCFVAVNLLRRTV